MRVSGSNDVSVGVSSDVSMCLIVPVNFHSKAGIGVHVQIFGYDNVDMSLDVSFSATVSVSVSVYSPVSADISVGMNPAVG